MATRPKPLSAADYEEAMGWRQRKAWEALQDASAALMRCAVAFAMAEADYYTARDKERARAKKKDEKLPKFKDIIGLYEDKPKKKGKK